MKMEPRFTHRIQRPKPRIQGRSYKIVKNQKRHANQDKNQTRYLEVRTGIDKLKNDTGEKKKE